MAFRKRKRIRTFWLPAANRFTDFNTLTNPVSGGGNLANWYQPLLSQEDTGAEQATDSQGNNVFGRLAHGERLVIDRIVGKVWWRVKNAPGTDPGGDVVASIRAAIVKIPWNATTGISQEAASPNDLWSLSPADAVLFNGAEAPRRLWYRSWAVNVGPLEVIDLEETCRPPAGYVDFKPKCKLFPTDRLFLVMQASYAVIPGGFATGFERVFSSDLRVLAHVQKGF